jgi:catechol 2,3-dioxygenase-like lactoylglutathione lyase family enzyme
MQIATCSFSEFKPEMGLPIRITLYPPRWPLTFDIPPRCFIAPLAPARSYFKAPDEVFIEKYLEQLDGKGPKFFQTRIEELLIEYEKETAVLLCYEKLSKGKWCHRTLFADYWLGKTGEEVPELGSPPPGAEPDVRVPDPDTQLF